MSGLDRAVSDSLFRHYLEGFPRYPHNHDSRLLEVFNESVISVSHARSVLSSFTTVMPTLQDVKDTAWNQRAKFEDHEPERERWEREYGRPDPNWSRTLTGTYGQQKDRMLWQAIRDAVYYTEGPGRSETKDPVFWSNHALRIRRDHPEELARFRQELSRGWEDLMRDDWVCDLVMPAPPPKPSQHRPITQADFEALKPRDVKMLAAGGDKEDRWE